MVYDYGLSDDDSQKQLDKLEEAQKQGNLGVVWFAHLNDFRRWMTLTPEEMLRHRERSELGRKAAKKESRFSNRYWLPRNQHEFKANHDAVSLSDITRIFQEYQPVLRGEKDPKYHIFPMTYTDNFCEEKVPDVIVMRLDSTLTFIDERVSFENDFFDLDWCRIKPEAVQEYVDFALNGKCNGFYVPKCIVRCILEEPKPLLVQSLINDDLIDAYLKQNGMFRESPIP